MYIKLIPKKSEVKKSTKMVKDRKSISLFRIKGFTLIEVLVVLVILALFFSTLTFTFKETYYSSILQKEKNLSLKNKAELFWKLSRAFYGAKKFVLKNGSEIYFVTTGGDIYKGVVKAVYKFENETLYYCEFPYTYGDFYECNKTYPLYRFKEFKVFAVIGNREEKDVFKKPKLLKVIIDGDTFYLKDL
jgi:prepilin-type N-terminal cleavage/methylation domain-containing protein